MAELHIGDLMVILGYFILVLAVGLWVSEALKCTKISLFLDNTSVHGTKYGAINS